MGEHLRQLQYLDSIPESYTNERSEAFEALYFPFFYIGDQREAKMHYNGVLVVADSLLIFRRSGKKAPPNMKKIKDFYIRFDQMESFDFPRDTRIFKMNSQEVDYLFIVDSVDAFRGKLNENIRTKQQ